MVTKKTERGDARGVADGWGGYARAACQRSVENCPHDSYIRGERVSRETREKSWIPEYFWAPGLRAEGNSYLRLEKDSGSARPGQRDPSALGGSGACGLVGGTCGGDH